MMIMAGFVCAGQKSSDAETGIEGVITVSPAQPGPARVGADASKPLPNTAFVVENEKGEVASFTTDDQGRFQISLLPGHYTISRKDWTANLGNYGPFEVDVIDHFVV